MPGSNIEGGSYFGGNLTAAVKAGTISEDRLDDMALRILAPWYLLGQDAEDYPKPNYNVNDLNDPLTNQHVDVQGEHWKVVREVGAASIVLLKNDGALPLAKPRTMVLVGMYILLDDRIGAILTPSQVLMLRLPARPARTSSLSMLASMVFSLSVGARVPAHSLMLFR